LRRFTAEVPGSGDERQPTRPKSRGDGRERVSEGPAASGGRPSSFRISRAPGLPSRRGEGAGGSHTPQTTRPEIHVHRSPAKGYGFRRIEVLSTVFGTSTQSGEIALSERANPPLSHAALHFRAWGIAPESRAFGVRPIGASP
jgi:hypothetical protein